MIINIDELVIKYKGSVYRDDARLKGLDQVDTIAVFWQLHTGAFDITGFSNKGFLRYLRFNVDFVNSFDKEKIHNVVNRMVA